MKAFEWDCNLRDLYVLNTTAHDWQRLVDFLLQSEYQNTYTVNGVIAEFPSRAPGGEIGQDDVSDGHGG